jgi:hypothetical protein
VLIWQLKGRNKVFVASFCIFDDQSELSVAFGIFKKNWKFGNLNNLKNTQISPV